MTPTFRLGKVFGIEIGANWSLLFIFALIAWTLASTVFPADVPGQPAGAYWAAGIAGAFVFYGCLLAHELAHAVMARRRGVRVVGITLWLFGGVSRLEGGAGTASAEAAITAVGPLTSLALAAAFFVLGAAVSAAHAPLLAGSVLSWLSYLNAALAIFNLVPAFPLDGGRLLGAIVWGRTGSHRRGVHTAVQVGRVFAALMIAAGLLELFLGDFVNGIWIAFIGWFLLSAAAGEEAGLEVKDLLSSIPVSAAMTSPVVTVPDWITLDQFLAGHAANYRFTTYPLHDPSGRLTGVARLSDLVSVPSSQRHLRRLKDSARPVDSLPRARPEDELTAVLDRAGETPGWRILVFDGDQLVGIVSPADVGRLLAIRRAAEAGRSAAA